MSWGQYAFINTVRDHLKMFSKREIAGADAALKIIK